MGPPAVCHPQLQWQPPLLALCQQHLHLLPEPQHVGLCHQHPQLQQLSRPRLCQQRQLLLLLLLLVLLALALLHQMLEVWVQGGQRQQRDDLRLLLLLVVLVQHGPLQQLLPSVWHRIKPVGLRVPLLVLLVLLHSLHHELLLGESKL